MTAPLAYRRILLKISGEALMGSEAVSYTHLDVYKRQAAYRIVV